MEFIYVRDDCVHVHHHLNSPEAHPRPHISHCESLQHPAARVFEAWQFYMFVSSGATTGLLPWIFCPSVEQSPGNVFTSCGGYWGGVDDVVEQWSSGEWEGHWAVVLCCKLNISACRLGMARQNNIVVFCHHKHGRGCPDFSSKISGSCHHKHSPGRSLKISSGVTLTNVETYKRCGHWLGSHSATTPSTSRCENS